MDVVNRRVWGKYLDVVHVANYYQRLADRLRKAFRFIRFLLAFLASINVASVFDLFSDVNGERVLVVSSILIVAVVIWDLTFDYGSKIPVVAGIAEECRNLVRKWEDLWVEWYRGGDEDEILKRNSELSKTLAKVTSKMDKTGMPDYKGLNEKSWAYANAGLKEKYAKVA